MTGTLAPLTVLIVDDSAHIRRLLMTMLRQMGCTRLIEARTLVQAQAALDAQTIDLVLVDWMLDDPEGTGMDLVRYIRHAASEEMPFMPIIMMTGHTERENIELARDMGVTEFMAKPFTAKNLHTRLSALIDQPRPFVRTGSFFGPDRRRRNQGPSGDGERRITTPRKQRSS